MAKRPDFEPWESERGWVVNIPKSMSASGNRARKYFANETKAKTYAASVRASHNSGIRGAMISATLALQAREAERLLDGSGISLVDAAKIAIAARGADEDRETFGERYSRAIGAMEMDWSNRYAADMGRVPRWVPEWFLAMPCGVITRSVMESALTGQAKIARSTIDNRARYLSAILGYRERHRKSSTVEFLTTSQCARLLRVCERVEERRVVALLLFAGIRPDVEHGEIGRLQWDAVGTDSIYVSSEVCKTNQDRLIPISSRLKRLIRGHPTSGRVVPNGWKKAWQRIRRDAGIAHLQDVCRHTFASHALAAWGEGEAKQAMGHTAGSTTLFRHYRRAVTKAAGEKYFR